MTKDSESSQMRGPETRRDFLYITTGAFAAFGIAALARPLTGHMSPAADYPTRKGLIIDLSTIPEGQQIKIRWRRAPVFIRHRTPEEISTAQSTDLSELSHKETDFDRLIAAGWMA